MVLESLITAKMAEKKPIKMLPLSFLYSSVGVLLALWIFPGSTLALIAFTVIATVPLMVNVMREEEKKEERCKKLIPLSSHKQILPFFLYLFIGLVLSFAVWFMILPYETVSTLFSFQLNSIAGQAAAAKLTFNTIFFNNLRVLAFAILFSLLYGAGAIFIITWNASLVGVAISNTIRSIVSIGGPTGYFAAVPVGVARYLTHGIPEIMAYFIAGLAGGILSVAIIKKQFGTPKFTRAMLDAFTLFGIAILLVIIAAIIEITISPSIMI